MENIEKIVEPSDPTEQLLTKLIGWVDSGGAFLEEQVPIFVQEIANFGLVSNGIGLVICLLVLLSSMVVFCIGARASSIKINRHENSDVPCSFCFVSGILGIACFIAGPQFLYWGLMALTSPRMYVLRTLQDLL